MKRLVLAITVAVCLLGVMNGCGDDSNKTTKPVTPPEPEFINELGSEYKGIYEVAAASGQCGFINCVWIVSRVDTVQLCGDEFEPLKLETNEEALFFVERKEGIQSDTAFNVIYYGQMGLLFEGDTCIAGFEIQINSKYGQEATIFEPGNFRIYATTKTFNCGFVTFLPVRYEFKRLESCEVQ